MAKMSPAVTRTVSVLNFFADHPGQAFTLTEIVRALKLSRATCHALLAALVEHNYLYRTSDKSYMLGSALARVATVAKKHLDPLQVAAGEMRTLADELDVICSAIFQDNGEAVVRERASSLTHIGWSLIGPRIPLHPPFGSVFLAWSKPAEVERWIGRMNQAPDEIERRQIIESLNFPRRHGFTFGIRKEQIRDQKHAETLAYRVDKTDYMMTELNLDAAHNLAFVAAPVFDTEGGVLFVLALMGFGGPMTGREVQATGARLVRSCERITTFLGGSLPRPGFDPN
jgi:DNA-binding IclR family transcriptional regulator